MLRKSLYGLKQASREWHAKLVEELINLDFLQSKNDYNFFIKKTIGKVCTAAVYVDDVILIRDDDYAIQELKVHQDTLFGINDMGALHYFLRIDVKCTDKGIILSQQKFVRKILEESSLDLQQNACTHLPVHLKLCMTDGDL